MGFRAAQCHNPVPQFQEGQRLQEGTEVPHPSSHRVGLANCCYTYLTVPCALAGRSIWPRVHLTVGLGPASLGSLVSMELLPVGVWDLWLIWTCMWHRQLHL